MRQIICTIALLCFVATAWAQTKDHKIGISIGGGPQDYNGERGNGFVKSDDIWRGAVVFNAGYYLNRSFDISTIGSFGDLGFCPDATAAATPIDENEQCPGCQGRKGIGNLSGRLIAFGLSMKYKFSNGYLLKEHSLVRPYIYLGAAANNISDPMKMNCIKVGTFTSLNAGLGANVYITKRFYAGYQLAFGYFTRDDIDFMAHDGIGDSYMQNSLKIGFDF
jgi:hypothetical protein